MNNSNVSEITFRTLQEINDATARKRLPTTIYLSILMSLGIIGNLLVICFYGQRKKKNNFRTFTVCLALIDLTACCIYMPVEIVDQLYPYMFYSEAACKICRFIGRVTTVGSALVLLVITLERHRKICLSSKRQISNKFARFLCGVALTVSILLSCPTLIFEGLKITHFDGNVTGFDCGTADGIRETLYPFTYTVILLVIYFSTFLTLIILYGFIIRIIIKKSKGLEESVTNRAQKAKPVTRILFCFTIAFIVSYLPHFGLEVNSTIKRGNYGPTTALTLAALPLLSRSYFINNVINPFILAIGDKKFRDGVWKMLKRCFDVTCRTNLFQRYCKCTCQKEVYNSQTESNKDDIFKVQAQQRTI